MLRRGDHVPVVQELARSLHCAGLTYNEAVDEFERGFILEILKLTNWNQCKAAPILGMHRNTLSRKIQELKLPRRRPAEAPARKPVSAEKNFRNEQIRERAS